MYVYTVYIYIYQNYCIRIQYECIVSYDSIFDYCFQIKGKVFGS